MGKGDASGTDKKARADARAARLERALKDNLRRRKAQSKAREKQATGDQNPGKSEA